MSHLGPQCFKIYLARYCLGFELYTLDQFNCRDTFIGQEKHDKEIFLFYMLIVLFVSPLKVRLVNAKDV